MKKKDGNERGIEVMEDNEEETEQQNWRKVWKRKRGEKEREGVSEREKSDEREGKTFSRTRCVDGSAQCSLRSAGNVTENE